MIENEFIIATGEDSITLKADPEMIRDLVQVLDGLLSLVRLTRSKVRVVEAERKIKLDAEQRAREQGVANEAKTIYRRYREHLNNGCAGNRTLAMQKIQGEFKLLAVDARIRIKMGKEQSKGEARHEVSTAKV